MRVIPVIDLQQGVVVRGVAGKREEYQAMSSRLAQRATPGAMARGLARHLGACDVYVADLDAIGGGEPAWSDFGDIAAEGPRLWIDAGVADGQRAEQLVAWGRDRGSLEAIIAGLETLPGPGMLAELVAVVGAQSLVFSLDLSDGRPLTPAAAWQGHDPRAIANAALAAGVRRFIVLDLAQVGVGQGTTTGPLCRWLKDQDESLQVVTGGGIRGRDDLRTLSSLGVDAALVASALHDGRLTLDDVRSVA